jgi:tellurite methyltransferase
MNESKDDRKYWSNFYKIKGKEIHDEHSDFAEFILNFFQKIKLSYILDVGCGNGRDSYYLSRKCKVLGVDNSDIKNIPRNNVIFENENFITIPKNDYDLIYSRFSFHSITDDEQINFIKSITPNTYLAIEARSINIKEGEELVHGKTHFRNYVNLDNLIKLLSENNFKILFSEESDNFAKYKNENPVCIRIICIKHG